MLARRMYQSRGLYHSIQTASSCTLSISFLKMSSGRPALGIVPHPDHTPDLGLALASSCLGSLLPGSLLLSDLEKHKLLSAPHTEQVHRLLPKPGSSSSTGGCRHWFPRQRACYEQAVLSAFVHAHPGHAMEKGPQEMLLHCGLYPIAVIPIPILLPGAAQRDSDSWWLSFNTHPGRRILNGNKF